uniref:Uncharacterized protein n=2 Tax=Clytia hemisphaerica TaxID=252671 RepID=A0A7M5UEP4_9CNID
MWRKEEAFMQNSVHFIRSLSDGEGCHDADRHDEVDDDSMPEVDHHDHVENNDGSDNPIESVSSESDDDNLKEVHSMPFDSPHNKSTAKLPKPKTPSTPLDKQHKPAKSSLSTPLDNQCKPAKSSPSTPLDKQRIPAKSSPSTPLGKQHKPAKSSPSTPLHKQHKPAKSSPSTPLDKQRNPAKSSPSTPLDKQHKPAKSSPSTQVDGKGKPAKTDFPSHNESPKSSASEILSPRKRLIASQMKGAAKSPYFQKPKSCYFCTLKENKAKETNAKIAELEDEIARLNRVLAGGNYIESLGRPKSGLIPSKIAKKYQLEQLAPGFDVYVDQEEFRTAATKSNGTGAVLFLLSCFYTHSELLEMNLTGENGKKPVNKEILKAMYAYALDKGDSKAKLAVALRNKIEQIRTRHRKASNQVEGENALTNNK